MNYDHNFHYSHILKASNYLRNPDCLFLATCLDDRIPSGSELVVPGVSPVARAIEACTYRKISNLGKRSREKIPFLNIYIRVGEIYR